MEALTPIDEEPCEELADEDQPITMIPRIVHTAPSPTTEANPLSNITSTSTINNEKPPSKPTNGNSKVSIASKNGSVASHNVDDTNEVNQIESVL